MFDDPISAALMILALIVAVIAGLWVGARLGEASTEQTDRKGKPRRSLGKVLQGAATSSAMRLWHWQRARAKKRNDAKS